MRQKTRQSHIGGTWCLCLARCDGVSSSSKRERREVSIQPNLSYHLLVGMNQEGKLNSSFLWGCFFYGLRTIHTQTKLYKIPEKTTAATVLTTDTKHSQTNTMCCTAVVTRGLPRPPHPLSSPSATPPPPTSRQTVEFPSWAANGNTEKPLRHTCLRFAPDSAPASSLSPSPLRADVQNCKQTSTCTSKMTTKGYRVGGEGEGREGNRRLLVGRVG